MKTENLTLEATNESRIQRELVCKLDDPQWYINRELSWLEFNRRVLAEAQDDTVPLLERLKFIAIFGSNLDEFVMKRIGGLKQQLEAGVVSLTVDGRTPLQQIEECYERIRSIEDRQWKTQRTLTKELDERGIHLRSYAALSAYQ